MSDSAELYKEALELMMIDCESRHYPTCRSCRESAEDLLAQFRRAVIREFRENM